MTAITVIPLKGKKKKVIYSLCFCTVSYGHTRAKSETCHECCKMGHFGSNICPYIDLLVSENKLFLKHTSDIRLIQKPDSIVCLDFWKAIEY